MLIEQRSVVKSLDKDDGFIAPGKTLKVSFETGRRDYPVERRLRVVGEVGVFWKWRQEAGFPEYVYRSIEDALDPADAWKEKYSLLLRGQGETYPRNAYLKIPRLDFQPGADYEFEVFAKAGGSRGEATVELGIYLEKPGRHPDDAFDPPDLVKTITLPPGTYGWKSFRADFAMPANAVLLLLRVGAKGVHGSLRLSTPSLRVAGGDSCVPPFCPPNPCRPNYNWLGENLSRKEWPAFEVRVDRQQVFRGPVFNAIFRRPDFEVPLPRLDAGNHELELELLQTSPLPFNVQDVEILERSARAFEVIAHPDHVAKGAKFPILLKTHQDNLALRCSGRKVTLERAGHHVVEAEAAGRVTVSDGQREEVLEARLLERADDGLRLSTGDAVYIPQTPDAFMRYLEWYAGNRVGDALCFRPVYRWSGSRELNPEAWRTIVPFLEKLGIHYSLMVDGRELPGMNANPPDSLLSGPFYLGRQSHENDGAFCYWNNRIWGGNQLPEPYIDIFTRSTDPGGIGPATRPARKGDKAYWFFDPEDADDMRAASELFVANLKRAKGNSTRHTGPSTLFRYFYQAGYEVLGAEQMYSAEEVVLSALRGAAKAYGKDTFAAHLAVQWSSNPHDTPEHAARYFLSLAACYLGGVKQINTEEGLWRMEAEYAGHDRFGSNCVRHREAHDKFRRFAAVHERRGAIHVPIGVLQGRFDGWRCFGRGNVWCRQGEQWKFGAPEESFDLLNVFYPRSRFDAIYRVPCPVAPQGWYSGTPFGAVDLLPVEAPELSGYRVLAFLGWNTYEPADFAKLLDFVERGGTLILAKPHLAANVKRGEASELRPDAALRRLLGDGFEGASGVVRREVGKGRVVYFADDLYPAAASIRQAYEAELAVAAVEVEVQERATGWLRGSDDVNFAAYDRGGGQTRSLYLLNIDWWSGAASAPATLLLGDAEFKVEARAGQIEVITIASGVAAMPRDSEIDVMDVKRVGDGVELTTQAASPGQVDIFDGRSGDVQRVEVGPGICKRIIKQ